MYQADAAFRQQTIDYAKDVSDHTERVVMISNADGHPLDYVDEDGVRPH